VNARDEVLARIRAAHAAAPPPALAYSDITRGYPTSADLDPDALVDRLVDRLVDYKALVRQARADELPAVIAAALTERGGRSVVVPAGLDPSWLSSVELDVRVDGPDPLSVADLDSADAVITACAAAVAETGTLVLDGSADQGRRVISLIPDYHLCLVKVEQICADVPQALARLDGTRPITMISGPSATSDIELDRVEGVHGPRTLEVIIVSGAHVVERIRGG
jgi:L-lactate dehydrogenase complex protein LldG